MNRSPAEPGGLSRSLPPSNPLLFRHTHSFPNSPKSKRSSSPSLTSQTYTDFQALPTGHSILALFILISPKLLHPSFLLPTSPSFSVAGMSLLPHYPARNCHVLWAVLAFSPSLCVLVSVPDAGASKGKKRALHHLKIEFQGL